MVFFVTGPDTYRARQFVRDLKEKFCRDVDQSGLNVATVAGGSLNRTDLANLISTAPLLARRRFVVIADVLTAGKPEVLNDLVPLLEREAASAQGNVVVFLEAVRPTKKHPLLTWLSTHARGTSFPLLVGDALTRWVTAELKRRGRIITVAARQRLLAMVGADTWRLGAELAKLDAALHVGRTVDEDAVATYVTPTLAGDVFGFVDAAVAGEANQAARVLRATFEAGASPAQLVALLEQALRVLLVLVAAPTGRAAPALAVPGVHPYVVRKLAPLARRLTVTHLAAAYRRLADLDATLKTSGADPETLLTTFAFRFARSARR
jgi:DNA polymerase III delta subunit